MLRHGGGALPTCISLQGAAHLQGQRALPTCISLQRAAHLTARRCSSALPISPAPHCNALPICISLFDVYCTSQYAHVCCITLLHHTAASVRHIRMFCTPR